MNQSAVRIGAPFILHGTSLGEQATSSLFQLVFTGDAYGNL